MMLSKGRTLSLTAQWARRGTNQAARAAKLDPMAALRQE